MDMTDRTGSIGFALEDGAPGELIALLLGASPPCDIVWQVDVLVQGEKHSFDITKGDFVSYDGESSVSIEEGDPHGSHRMVASFPREIVVCVHNHAAYHVEVS